METRTWRLFAVEWELEQPESELRARAARAVGASPELLRGFRIARRSLDARRRDGRRRLRYVGHLDLVLPASFHSRALARLCKRGAAAVPAAPEALAGRLAHATLAGARVCILGSGPAGLFAALALAENGVPATVIERGPPVRERARRVVRFHRTRRVDPEANLLFGEGGAGTFSDGKIYTRVDDPLEVTLLEALVAAGAPPAIPFDTLAHIGTDRLHRLLPVFRTRLERAGIAFRFGTRVEGLVTSGREPRRVRALRTSAGEIPCDALILAPGHSARDTWDWLARDGVPFEARPFQLGLRIEHPQELIDRGRYGDDPRAALLGAASYRLVARAGPHGPGAHTFCMCPGGRIVASIHTPGVLCTNGMSNSKHSSRWATAAVVTTVGPRRFGGDPFAGVALQESLERAFFAAGGCDYTAPAQSAADFLLRRRTKSPRRSTYPFGTVGARLDELLPDDLAGPIAHALARFDRALPGYAGPEGLLVGIESRSSGPVRIPRDRTTRRARGFQNLWPVGEGAGWAGGIMSAALDGARAALDLIERGTGLRPQGAGATERRRAGP